MHKERNDKTTMEVKGKKENKRLNKNTRKMINVIAKGKKNIDV